MKKVAELSYNWQKAAKGVPVPFPDMKCVSESPLDDSPNHVFVKEGWTCVSELEDWLVSNTHEPYEMFARFSWTRHEYYIERVFEGLTFVFNSIPEAAAFRNRWVQRLN